MGLEKDQKAPLYHITACVFGILFQSNLLLVWVVKSWHHLDWGGRIRLERGVGNSHIPASGHGAQEFANTVILISLVTFLPLPFALSCLPKVHSLLSLTLR